MMERSMHTRETWDGNWDEIEDSAVAEDQEEMTVTRMEDDISKKHKIKWHQAIKKYPSFENFQIY